MSREAIVTRGSQVTLTKTEREKAGIREGDRVVINVYKDAIIISNKNPNVFDKFESFLPTNFGDILKKMRSDEKERLKNYLLTLNKQHFEFISELKGKVLTPEEMNVKINR